MSDDVVAEIKRGRGKPKGTVKADARRHAMKLRWKEDEIEMVTSAAVKIDEDLSHFIRESALSRARAVLNK